MGYKSFINFIKKIHFSDNEHYKLLNADGFANKIVNNGIDFFKKDYGFNLKMSQLQYKLFIPYIMEKFIVFSSNQGKKELFPNNIAKFFNTFNELSNFSETPKDQFLKKLMFMFSYEQIYLQENNHTAYMFRLKNLYRGVAEVDNLIQNHFNINFNKFIFLHWALLTYIIDKQETDIYFSINGFIKFAINKSNFNIFEQEIRNFLDYVLISEDNFKEEYFKIRKKQNTKEYISYDKLTYIDRYLPRISYWYPLIKINNQMKLISYTSLSQFMKFDRLYSFIYHNTDIYDFKSKIHGPCVTNYIKEYARKNVEKAKIYGDEDYFIGRNKYQAPDIIIEFDDYVFIIEAKSKPFNILKALTEFDAYNFDKIQKDKEKSIKNIERYLENQNSFENKKVYKFICYFFNHPGMVSEMEDDIFDLNRIIITDVHSIESLLSIQNEEYNKVVDSFLITRKKHCTSSLYHFCRENYQIRNNSNSEFKDFIKTFIKSRKDN